MTDKSLKQKRRELAHRYAPQDEFHQDKIAALCAAGGEQA